MNHSFTVHHTAEAHPDTSVPDPHQDTFSKTFLGFWIYLMTDCVLFATLFITYAVLHRNTFGGPSGKELFDLSLVAEETFVLLVSSLTCGFVVVSAARRQREQVIAWMGVTMVLGATFLCLELFEFTHLIQRGYSWRESAFLSSFFALVGAHGLHITTGLLWAGVVIGQLFFIGLTADIFRRIVLFSLFWHFLDLIWIFIFTIVYLMGVA